TMEKLATLRSLPRGFERSKWGEAILEAVARGPARGPETGPRIRRRRGAGDGGGTRRVVKGPVPVAAQGPAGGGEGDAPAAAVDDLERIAADDAADVAALRGWRRELFGEKALALKRGQLALAIENGRVVPVERN